MRFSASIIAAAALLLGSASAIPFVPRQNTATPEQISALAPDLGAQPNTNPNPFGDCDGPRQLDGNIPKVPCVCPPLRDRYIQALTANVQAGRATNNPSVRVSFPTGDSVQDKKGRITAAIITLQNLDGPGRGCPGVSTTLGAQSKALDDGVEFVPPQEATIAPVPAPASSTPVVVAPPPTNTPVPDNGNNGNNGGLTRELVEQLAPDLGAQPNTNPNPFGDCDGPRQLDGNIPKVPCACPPERTKYIDQLFANAVAGKALNNPTVRINFPTGDSVQDKKGRITAAIITLQNLDGPGRGCPGVSTTLGAQSKALDDGVEFVPPAENNNNGNNGQNPVADPAVTTDAPEATPTPAPEDDDTAGSTTTVTSTTVLTLTTTITRDRASATPTPEEESSSEAPVATSSASTPPQNNGNNGNNGLLTRDLVASLAPELGSQPNTNPNRFGDCDGPRQPNGKIPKVPCACPPEREAFIDQLFANAAAGRALKNPSVRVNFPTGNSIRDKKDRITASIITLQNLNGPGRGCPGVSTTLAAQNIALGN